MHVYYPDTSQTDALMEKLTAITAMNAIVTPDHNEAPIMEKTIVHSIDETVARVKIDQTNNRQL